MWLVPSSRRSTTTTTRTLLLLGVGGGGVVRVLLAASAQAPATSRPIACRWHVSTDPPLRWRARLEGGAPVSDADALDAQCAGRPVLCRVVLGRGRRRPDVDDDDDDDASSSAGASASTTNNKRDAIVTFATSAAYLVRGARRKKGATLELWPALVSKAAYATRHGLDLYVYLSNATLAPTRRTTPSCAEAPSPHYLKILAVLAVLEDDAAAYRSATYVDADARIENATVTPRDYLEVGDTDLIVSSNVNHVPILANGGVWVARNAPFARRVLRAWFDRRCGPKDQLGLWGALFAAWGLPASSSAADNDSAPLFANYDTARAAALPAFLDARRRGALPVVDDDDAADGFADSCAAGSRCAAILDQTGCLVAPLRVGTVLLLPVVPFATRDGRRLPPLQTEHPHPGWWCHKKCPTPTSFVDALNETTRRRLAPDAVSSGWPTAHAVAFKGGDPCIDTDDRKSGVFVCPCGRLVPHLDACSADGFRDPICIADAVAGIGEVRHHHHHSNEVSAPEHRHHPHQHHRHHRRRR